MEYKANRTLHKSISKESQLFFRDFWANRANKANKANRANRANIM